MAHALITQKIVDGERITVIKTTIKGDGASPELNQEVLFSAAAFLTQSIYNKIMEIEYNLNGFSAELFWDATSPVAALSLAKDHPHKAKFWDVGGIVNNGGSGQTGDIKISTVGLNASTKDGYMILYLMERKVDKFMKV